MTNAQACATILAMDEHPVSDAVVAPPALTARAQRRMARKGPPAVHHARKALVAHVDTAEAERLYRLGYPAREVAAHVGCSDTFILDTMDERGVPRRPRSTKRPDYLPDLPLYVREAPAEPVVVVLRDAPAPSAPRLPEIPAKTMRFVRWFVRAGWREQDIAWLFNLDVPSLKAAIYQENPHAQVLHRLSR